MKTARPSMQTRKSIIDKQVSDMQTNAWNLVKWKFSTGSPTRRSGQRRQRDRNGVAVQPEGKTTSSAACLTQNWILNETVTKLDGKDGTLTGLEPAIQKNLDKYLSIIDIGQYFHFLVAATPNIDFTKPSISPIPSPRPRLKSAIPIRTAWHGSQQCRRDPGAQDPG